MSNLPVKSVKALTALIDKQENNLVPLLPQGISLDFMKANFVAAVGANPKLLNCTGSSLMKSVFEACELGLMVHSSLGEAYVVPYKSTATFIPGYKGLVKLAYQSGFVSLIESRVVYSEDEFVCEYGLHRKLKLIEAEGNRGAPIGVYCMIVLSTGQTAFEYMTINKIMEIHEKSSGYRYFKSTGKGKEIWGDEHNILEMHMKAVFRHLSKWVPRSGTRYTKALNLDNGQYTGAWDEMEDTSEEELYASTRGTVPATETVQNFFVDTWNDADALESDLPKVLSLMGYDAGTALNESDAVAINKLTARALVLEGKRMNKEENRERVLAFFKYCIYQNYLLRTTREVDSARSAFVEWEKLSDG